MESFVGPFSVTNIVVIIGIFVSLLLGLINVYLQLYSFNKKQKQELFEMRFSFYLELSEKRTKSYNDNKDINSDELFVLSRKAKFLFNKDISDYILELNTIRRQNSSYNNENEFSNKFNKYLKLK